MKLMDGPWRRQAAGAAFGFAVILSQSPAQAQFYGNWGPYPFPMPPMPPPVIYPRATQPGYQPFRLAPSAGWSQTWGYAWWRRPAKMAASILRKPKTRTASVAGSCSTPMMEPWSKMLRSEPHWASMSRMERRKAR